jgi:2-methylcitrate dehydratase PrpD
VIGLKVIIEHARVTENGDVSVLAWAASESRPGVRHGVYVLLDTNGRILRALCDCEGFVYRKSCKHVEWVRVAALARLGKILELKC